MPSSVAQRKGNTILPLVFSNKRIALTSFDGAVSGYCAHGDGGDNSDDVGTSDAKDGFNWNQKRSFQE